MRRFRLAPIFAVLLTIGLGMPALAQESVIGASVDSLLDFAKTRNPEYAAMQAEAEASGQRITPAGALPDPRLRAELMDTESRQGFPAGCLQRVHQPAHAPLQAEGAGKDPDVECRIGPSRDMRRKGLGD